MRADSSGLSYQPDFRAGNTKWSTAYKAKRALWAVAYLFLFRPTPKRMGNRWRVFILRLFGASIRGTPYFSASCRILDPGNLSVGAGSVIGDGAYVYNYAKVEIGSMVVISQGAVLCTGTHDYLNCRMPLIWRPITIGNLVWVCYEAFVHPGVVLEDGVILGARAVADKTLLAWGIYAGNPATLIKKREAFKK